MKKILAGIILALSLTLAHAEDPLDLLSKAKTALILDAEASIEILNSILLLPKNPATEEAQFYIGLAYEKAGKYSKAKIENKLFLQEYPNSDRYGAVKRRQLVLEIDAPDAKINKEKFAVPKTGSETKFSGGISTYISENGKSTSFRTDYYYREAQYSARAVVKMNNKHRSDVAYIDLEDSFTRISTRIGKQNSLYGIQHKFSGISARANISDYNITMASDGKDSTLAVEAFRDYTVYASNKGPGVEIRSTKDQASTILQATKDTQLLSSTYYGPNYTLYTLYNKQYTSKMILFGFSKPISKDTTIYVDLQNFKTINLHILNPKILNIYILFNKDTQSVTALHSRTFDNFRLDLLVRYSRESLGYDTLTSSIRGLYKYSDTVYIESQLSVARNNNSFYLGYRQEF